jgi:hypothetical protein
VTRTALAIALGSSIAAFATAISADPKPPADGKPLSAIAADVERAGYAPIVDASIEGGMWEIDAYQGDTEYELRVDPISGEIKSKKIDDDKAATR